MGLFFWFEMFKAPEKVNKNDSKERKSARQQHNYQRVASSCC